MSAFVSAAGQLFTGDAQGKAYDYNARVERQQADESLTSSYIKAGQIERGNAQARGAMTAAYGASGVTPQGTPMAVMLDQASHGEMNRRLTKYQGELDALGHNEQSDADIASGKASRIGSYFAAGTTLLTSATKMAESGSFG